MPIIYFCQVHQYDPFGHLQKPGLWTELSYYFLVYVVGTVIIFGAYKLLHLCLRFTVVNKLVALTLLTSFKFWRRYRAPKNP
ncbi:MAG: hypothetical protein L3J66_05680 [Bacteroidales bacterium]|nr:hypothetical protein [Bacteroidales bacterium]